MVMPVMANDEPEAQRLVLLDQVFFRLDEAAFQEFTALIDASLQPNLEAQHRTLKEHQPLVHIRREDDLLLARESGAARCLTVVA
jgi:hypothetical protein